jgi:hypothetical protein
MQRSLLASLFVSLLAAAILFSGVGCGGGGGGTGGTSSTSGSTGTPSGAVFSQQIVGITGSSVARGLGDLAVGDSVDLRSLDLYSEAGTAYGTLANIALTASPTVATVSGTTLHAVGVGTATITATNADGTPLHDGAGNAIGSTTIVVSPVGARVTGRVRGVITTTAAAAGIGTTVVRFFDSGGSVVAETPSGPDGRYQANVPTNAVSFIVDFAAMPNTYYNQFTYGSLDYSATINGCGVPLPTLSVGGSAPQNDAITYRRGGGNPPPPPPSGCGD